MYKMEKIINTILNGDVLDELKKIPSESVDVVITSPPYWSLRDYECEKQIGNELDFNEYLDKLIIIFNEVYRVLKKEGSCWINIGDTYSKSNKCGVKKSSVIGIPDRFKIRMIDNGWICRNEIIWHKPNAIPSSAKNRFGNDYEKMFFFTKDDLYYFETQYEKAKTTSKHSKTTKKGETKYKNVEQESSVRQGMNKERGNKLIKIRNELPTQEEFVNFLRKKTNIKTLSENSGLQKTKIEHWFRRDKKGFAFPSIEDWNEIKWLLNDWTQEFNEMDYKLTHYVLETDDIYKNIDKGRIKRSVWSINTKPSKEKHFATFPEALIETPIKACCPKKGIVLDIFMGSGTTGIVALKNDKNYIGIELNKEYVEIANKRIKNLE